MAKTDECVFCELLKEKDEAIFYHDPSGLFAAMWTSLPAYPGHALVIPTRHFQYFRDMNDKEMEQVAKTVATVKTKIEQMDLKEACNNLSVISDESKEQIAEALEFLKAQKYASPTAFNDGINDGPDSGQTVPHFHWHVVPRWPDTGGGIVQRFKDKSKTL